MTDQEIAAEVTRYLNRIGEDCRTAVHTALTFLVVEAQLEGRSPIAAIELVLEQLDAEAGYEDGLRSHML
jgi:hypothetical protein